MITAKKRLPGSATVQQTAIQQATSLLEQLPEKPKEIWSLREAIDLLQDSITTALARGYSHEEVATMLADQGIKISVSSLKRYLASIKKDKVEGAAVKPRRPRRTAAQKQAETGSQLAATPEPLSDPSDQPLEAGSTAPASTTKRTTRRPTSTRAKASARVKSTSARTRKK